MELRRLIAESGDRDNDFRVAFEWLAQELRSGDLKRGGIYVPRVRDARAFAPLLGEAATERLLTQREIAADDIAVELIIRRGRPVLFDGPVLVPWASLRMITEVESMRPSAICVTTWMPDELTDWKRVYGPIDVRSGKRVNPPAELSLVLRGAVRDLTCGVADDVTNDEDRGRAIRVFKALRITGHKIDSSVVRAEAMRLGWDPDPAGRLAAIAEDIAEGKALHGGAVTKTAAKTLVAWFEKSGGDEDPISALVQNDDRSGP